MFRIQCEKHPLSLNNRDLQSVIMTINNKIMTSKTTKTLLFAAIIAAMILPFSVTNFATAELDNTTKYEPSDVTGAIQQITPYVYLDEIGLVKFNTELKEIPLRPETIQIAYEFIQIQNLFRNQAQENLDKKPTIDEELKYKFSKFVDDIQEKKKESEVKEISAFDFILPEAFAWGEVCGGAPWNPQSEPNVLYLTSSIGAVNYLVFNGYHLVPAYASGLYGDDYAREIGAFGCNYGEMRSQGIVTGTYSYNSQSPEPNPEILSYTAPVWWWDGYVLAWHIAN